jgi:4'-phosphopantetheinyl transferase EntD
MTTEQREHAEEHRPAGDLSSLQRLFAAWPVVTEEARLPLEPPPIPAEEAAQVAHAVIRRRVEFAMGRLCARRALARLGIDSFILRNDAHRAPQWPPGIVGSLTHTGEVPGGYCAAAVVRADAILTIGLDAEKADALPLHLWRFVLTSGEQSWLNRQETERQGILAKVIFSAKESFYKAQFPVTGRRLGFHDVELELDVQHGGFVTRGSESSLPGRGLDAWTGRFALDEELVRTAIVCTR